MKTGRFEKRKAAFKAAWGRALPAILICVLAACAASACGPAPEEVEAIDLTSMSMVVRNAEISNIQTRPEEYEGRHIRISGQYGAAFSESLGRKRHFVLLSGGDACCPSVVMEFVKGGEYIEPEEFDEYPVPDTMIQVNGVFRTYGHVDAGILYQYLEVVEIEW